MRITKNCIICNTVFTVGKYKEIKTCSRPCANLTRCKVTQPLADRFWSKVKIGPEEECWDWQASLGTHGVPQFYYKGKPQIANRVAYELAYGEFAKELHVCHYCDRSICVNPNHLWLGTNRDNHRDCASKGRNTFPFGVAVPQAKLNPEKVIEIRRLYATGQYTRYQIAELYDCSHATVSAIINGKAWKQVA